MRLNEPRLAPVGEDELHALEVELFGAASRGPALNVMRTWARHPALMKAQRPMQDHIMRETTLPARHRELAILRIGWHCRSGYEMAQHAVFGRAAGLDTADLQRVTDGPDAEGWAPIEAAILRAVDEMFADAFVSDTTWAALAAEYSPEQLVDLLITVGRYWTVSVVLNTLGVQLEPTTLTYEAQLES